MQEKQMFYDGRGENKQTTGDAAQQSSMIITEEMRKSIGGNPYVFVK